MNALFRRGGKHLQYSVANIFRTISTKFYQNRPSFVDDVTKTFAAFLGGDWNLQDWKMTDHQTTGGGICRTGK